MTKIINTGLGESFIFYLFHLERSDFHLCKICFNLQNNNNKIQQ